MSYLRFFKVLSLPVELIADAIYYVKNGDTIDQYVTDSNAIALPVKSSELPESIDPRFVTMVATENLGGHRSVSLVSNNGVAYTDPTQYASCQNRIGLTNSAVSNGGSIVIQISGVMIEPSWNWVANQMVWVSASGQLTQSLPVDGYLVSVGLALTPTSINLNFESLIKLL